MNSPTKTQPPNAPVIAYKFGARSGRRSAGDQQAIGRNKMDVSDAGACCVPVATIDAAIWVVSS